MCGSVGTLLVWGRIDWEALVWSGREVEEVRIDMNWIHTLDRPHEVRNTLVRSARFVYKRKDIKIEEGFCKI